jgi:hypothetical protein
VLTVSFFVLIYTKPKQGVMMKYPLLVLTTICTLFPIFAAEQVDDSSSSLSDYENPQRVSPVNKKICKALDFLYLEQRSLLSREYAVKQALEALGEACDDPNISVEQKQRIVNIIISYQQQGLFSIT